jgi:ferredoxin
MNTDTDNIRRFCDVFKIPEFMKPWLDRFFEQPEIDLVLMLADRPMNPEEVEDRNRGNYKTERIATVGSFLERAYKRGVINRRKDGRYEPADLHTRYDVWAMFEGKQIYFNKDLCRGCGVCSTACPEEAITMIPLAACNETHSLITQVLGEPKPVSRKSQL